MRDARCVMRGAILSSLLQRALGSAF
jgi:hypothetical protein